MAPREPLLTRRELAEALRVSVDAIDKLVHDAHNPLPRFKAGRRYLFRLDEVLDCLRDHGATSKRRGGGREQRQ